MGKVSKLGSFSVLPMGLCLVVTSCNKNPEQPVAQQQSSDPAEANVAAVGQRPVQGGTVPGQQASPRQPQPSYQSGPSYQAGSAPAYQGNDQTSAYYADDADYGEQPVEAEQPPPPLPEYSQPECPGENYIWTPGYWGYASVGYYWVPGAWVVAPYVGALWTPPYWAFGDGRYRWHHGYWGSHIGYYGGINYGSGYVGRGYEGGYWNNGVFNYNRSVNNVNTSVIHNVYSYGVTNSGNRVSYNGGRGGLNVQPTASERAVLHEQRIAPIPAQVQHMRQAAGNRAQFAAVNHGRPETVAAARPLATEYRAPASHASAVPGVRTLPRMTARQEAAPIPQIGAQTQPNGRPGERPIPYGRAETRANPGQPAARTAEPTPARVEERPAARTSEPPRARRSRLPLVLRNDQRLVRRSRREHNQPLGHHSRLQLVLRSDGRLARHSRRRHNQQRMQNLLRVGRRPKRDRLPRLRARKRDQLRLSARLLLHESRTRTRRIRSIDGLEVTAASRAAFARDPVR